MPDLSYLVYSCFTFKIGIRDFYAFSAWLFHIMQNKKIILVAAVSFAFVLCYFPAFVMLFDKWSNSEDYAHAFLIVPIVIYMIWLKRDCFLNYSGHGAAGLLFVVFSLLFYVISLQIQIPTIIFLAIALTIASVLVYLGGLVILKELAIPVILIFMIIPIPNQLYSMITLPLQLKVTQVNEFLVHLSGVPIYREGNVLQIPGKSFQVVEACSGLRSLIALTTLSLVFGYFSLRKSWLKGLLFASSLPIAFLVNVIRVFVLVTAFHFFGLDLTAGAEHTMTGMVVFLFGLAFLFGVQRILESWET